MLGLGRTFRHAARLNLYQDVHARRQTRTAAIRLQTCNPILAPSIYRATRTSCMYNQLHPIRRCERPDGNVKFSDISATAPGPQQTGGGRAELRSYVPAPHGRCRDAAAESVPTPARSPSAPPRSPLPVQRAGVRPGRTTEPPGSPACNRVSYVARTAPHVGTRTVARPVDRDTTHTIEKHAFTTARPITINRRTTIHGRLRWGACPGNLVRTNRIPQRRHYQACRSAKRPANRISMPLHVLVAFTVIATAPVRLS